MSSNSVLTENNTLNTPTPNFFKAPPPLEGFPAY